MTPQFADIMSSLNVFDVTVFLFSSLATGPSLTSVSLFAPYLWQFSFVKHRTEISKSEFRRLGQVKDTKFGTNVSKEMLLSAAKCQGYSFYRFYVI